MLFVKFFSKWEMIAVIKLIFKTWKYVDNGHFYVLARCLLSLAKIFFLLTSKYVGSCFCTFFVRTVWFGNYLNKIN